MWLSFSPLLFSLCHSWFKWLMSLQVARDLRRDPRVAASPEVWVSSTLISWSLRAHRRKWLESLGPQALEFGSLKRKSEQEPPFGHHSRKDQFSSSTLRRSSWHLGTSTKGPELSELISTMSKRSSKKKRKKQTNNNKKNSVRTRIWVKWAIRPYLFYGFSFYYEWCISFIFCYKKLPAT